MGTSILPLIVRIAFMARAQAIQSSWMETPEILSDASAPDVSGGCNARTANEFGFLYAKSRIRFDENNPFIGLVTGSREDPHYTLLVNSSYTDNIRNSTDEECNELFNEYDSTQDYTQFLLESIRPEVEYIEYNGEIVGIEGNYLSQPKNNFNMLFA